MGAMPIINSPYVVFAGKSAWGAGEVYIECVGGWMGVGGTGLEDSREKEKVGEVR